MRRLRLGMQLGLFQLSLGILGVLILGLLNRLLIQDILLPAVLAALAVGGQQLMGFTRAWFGHRRMYKSSRQFLIEPLHNKIFDQLT